MRESELNRSQEYRILVNIKLKNPPIGETVHRFEFKKEKLNETLTNWDSLSEEDRSCSCISTPTKLFKEWFIRYLGIVDFPPDERDDRPNATLLKIKDEDPDYDRDILLEYDPRESGQGNFAYLVTPIVDMKDFENICEHILLPSRIFQLSGVLSIIRQHLPPDTRSWITDGQNFG